MTKSAWLLLLLWIPTAAFALGAMGFDEARHLLNRTGVAANLDDINAVAKRSREQAVEKLLDGTLSKAVTPMPAAVENFDSPRRLRTMSEEERREARRIELQQGVALREWWMTEMLDTPSPLTEKMVLFWHNHFVSSLQKVRSPALMYRQNVLLRKYALGNFAELLHEISRDPAMVLYLDSASNRKGQPNENFAREVMELFTLGEGNYTEPDIKEAARAFTGWSIDPDTGEFLLRRAAHDDGVKTLLGRSGNFDGDDVLDILLAQPQTAEFVVRKLWREFVSPTPDPAEVQRIAQLFRDSRYDIKVALRALLTSDDFYAAQNRAVLIKSPVELIVGTLRQFRFETGDALPFVLASRQLGQDLFAPPNVKGWQGGEAWINTTTLLLRKQLLNRLFSAKPTPTPPMAAGKGAAPATDDQQRFARAVAGISFNAQSWIAQFRSAEPAVAKVVLATGPVNPASNTMSLGGLRQLVLDPVYQLK